MSIDGSIDAASLPGLPLSNKADFEPYYRSEGAAAT
jgi:hypothetical protein